MTALSCRVQIEGGGECNAPGGECAMPSSIGLVTMKRVEGVMVLILMPVCPDHVAATVQQVKSTVQGDEWTAIALTDVLGGGLR